MLVFEKKNVYNQLLSFVNIYFYDCFYALSEEVMETVWSKTFIIRPFMENIKNTVFFFNLLQASII